MQYEEILAFIRDGIKFVQVFAGVINKSTPHLYLSGLPFSPCKSVMAQYLVKQFPRIAKVAVGKLDNWPKNQQVLQGHTDSVNSVAFSPDGRHIVSGSYDSTLQVWDAQTGEQVGNPFQGHTSSVWSVAFSPDGRHIISGSDDRTIRIWDAKTGDQVGNPLQGHTDSVNTVAFSQDGRYIVSGSDDTTIQVWDAHTGDQVGNPLQGHTDLVICVAFSPDGRYIASGSADCTIQVWDAQTGDQVGDPLQGHTHWIRSVSFSQDGRHIVSGSDDMTIRVWDSAQIYNDVRQGTKFISGELLPICFSSSPAHALHDAQSLFIDVSDVEEDCRDLVYLQDDGWIVGPNEKLLLWVPLSYRSFYFYTPWTNLILPKGGPELDLSMMAHGLNWHQCYTFVPTTMVGT